MKTDRQSQKVKFFLHVQQLFIVIHHPSLSASPCYGSLPESHSESLFYEEGAILDTFCIVILNDFLQRQRYSGLVNY
jgi:hypothetical protein